MTTIQVKTIELVGPALHWAVATAVAEDVKITISRAANSNHHEAKISCKYLVKQGQEWVTSTFAWTSDYAPSSDWLQTGALLNTHFFHVDKTGSGSAAQFGHEAVSGDDLQLAICRAVVLKNIGALIDIPSELNVGFLFGKGSVIPIADYTPRPVQ